MMTTEKVLLTSVLRPLGEKYGDGPSVGYELLYGQVTRAQGLFSPRANHIHFSLEYIAENLDAPTTVLQYPNRREFIKELRKGYSVIGVSFILATFHRMKEVVALIREYSPSSRIVLGGYGTVLSDEELHPYGDAICREEGVSFMRQYLGEPEIPMPYRHPLIISRLKFFGKEASSTGIIMAGLGCPNGCDFCCTSHFFKRKHIRLLPTGRDIYNAIERYLDVDPDMSMVVLDEDFLLNKKRALEFRDCVLEGGRPISVFVFSSVKAISQYTVTQILEMGIDGFWIGYEGTRSGFAKQDGRPVDEIFREFREHGITILASMVLGFPYQTPEIIEEELSQLLALKPGYCQFLIYGPTPGTPFYKHVMEENLLHKDLADDRERYYKECTGFRAMVRHPQMAPEAIEALQTYCFDEDLRRLGPSVFRTIETWYLGYLKLKDSENPFLRKKAERFAREIRNAYPVFLAGRTFACGAAIRKWIKDLEARIYKSLGPPSLSERAVSVGALGLAAGTGLTLKFGWFQHPRLIRNTFRMGEESLPARLWRRLCEASSEEHRVEVELRPESTVWVRVEGTLSRASAERLAERLRDGLAKRKERLVLDFNRVRAMEEQAACELVDRLKSYADRVRVIGPRKSEFAALAGLFSLYP